MNIRPMGDELFHADWRTDMTKLIVVFYNVANEPESVHKYRNCILLSPGHHVSAVDSHFQGLAAILQNYYTL